MLVMVPEITTVKGTPKKTYPKPEDVPEDLQIFGSLRTFGGTETTSNDLYVVLDTAVIETWYRPDIKSDCRLYIIPTGDIYEITGTPENIYMQNQYLKIRAKRVGGVA
jgi:hypothetical protein